MRLVWGKQALADRRAIFDYLESRNPIAAIDMDEAIEAAVQQLRSFPNMARPGRVEGTRELVLIGTPYIVAYIVLADRVKLLRVLHGARTWPTSLPDD
jgi:addiction module RelE/StbE family toxin